jgi:hypothetical protein
MGDVRDERMKRPVKGSELMLLNKWQLIQVIKDLASDVDPLEVRRIVEDVRDRTPPSAATGKPLPIR